MRFSGIARLNIFHSSNYKSSIFCNKIDDRIIFQRFLPGLRLFHGVHFIQADEMMEHCKDRDSGGGMDVQLGADIPSMGGDGVDGKIEPVGNFLIG